MGILNALASGASQASFLFEVKGSTAKMQVVDFSVNENISQSYLMKVQIASATEIKSFDDIIDHESVLTVINNDILSGGGNRYFHGVVRKFKFTGMNGLKYQYAAEVVPAIHFMGLRRNCRIFQEKNTQDIIKTLLDEAGIRSDRYRFSLSDTERERGYCVQYQESDLDFISRLMQEEGIYYYFEHYEDKHILVIADNKAVHQPISGVSTVTCNAGGMVAEKDYIYDFTFSQRQTPESFIHSNFNFKKPTLDLNQKRTDGQKEQYEIYDYSAMHTTQAKGETLARIRIEQLRALQKQGHGQSTCCRLIPGYKVTLTDHPSSSLNAEYLIVDVSHGGNQPQTREENASGAATYSNTFTVIPAKTQYRPPVLMNRPTVSGVQTAIVVGPSSEEIYTDEHGRVRVQFHWDREGQRNEKSSCWLRVSQSWGGGDWGSQFIPRIGDEVLVDFIEGNPDRPIVTGCVYNGDNIPINPLTKSITQSGFRTRTHKGEGFHELRFDDKTGEEEIYLQSQKDWNILIKNDKGQNVGHDETLNVTNNRTKTVGVDQSETIGNNKTITVGVNHTETIGANMNLNVSGLKNEVVTLASTETVGAAKALTVGAGYAVTVIGGMNTAVGLGQFEEVGLTKQVFVGKNLEFTVGDNVTITCGQSQISMDKSGKVIISGTSFEFNGADHIEINSTLVEVN